MISGKAYSPPPIATDSAPGLMPALDRYAVSSTVANWAEGTNRFFMVSASQGNDANQGWSDGAPDASKAVATLARLRQIFAEYGGNRRATIIIEEGNYSTEPLTLRGIVGYSQIVIRGTRTDSTAGCVAFDNSTGDKRLAGHVRATGTESQGYRVSANSSTSAVDCVKVADGTAPSWPAEPALLSMRIRFDANTPTVALRNVCTLVWKYSGSTMQFGQNIATAPAAGGAGVGDVFYIEEPGVQVQRVIADGVMCGRSESTAGGVSNRGLQLVGLKGMATSGSFILRNVFHANLVNCHAPNSGGSSGQLFAQGCVGIFGLNSYVDENGTSISTGGGNRFVHNSSAFVVMFETDQMSINYTWFIGGSSINLTARSMIYQHASGMYGCGTLNITSTGTLSTSAFGNHGAVNTRRTRIVNPTGLACRVSGFIPMNGVDIEGLLVNQDAIHIASNGAGTGGAVSIDGVSATCTGTGRGIVFDGCRGTSLTLGWFGSLAITCAQPYYELTVGGAVGVDMPRYAISDIITKGMVIYDDHGNSVAGPQHTFKVVSEYGTTYNTTAAGGIIQFGVVRRREDGGTDKLQLAQANSSANSTGVVGVVVSIPRGDATGRVRVVTRGPVWVEFDSAPTATTIGPVYLSPTTAGKATLTSPAVSGSNQKLRLGQFLGVVSGNLGLVALAPELVPVTADANP